MFIRAFGLEIAINGRVLCNEASGFFRMVRLHDGWAIAIGNSEMVVSRVKPGAGVPRFAVER